MEKQTQSPAGADLATLVDKIDRFFFAPASALPLGALRIGIALCLLLQAYWLRGVALDFLSTNGIIQGQIAALLRVPDAPQISWISDALASRGVSETTCIYGVCWLYVVSTVLFGLGLFTRVTSVLTWLLHWILMNTAYSTSYGVDLFSHVFLFYLMFMPAGDALSLDALFRGRWDRSSSWARLSLRILQLHLCIMYLSSGIEKSMGVQWWNGELLWRSFYLPVYKQYDMTWIVNYPWLSMAFGWATLALELGYCVFIWPRLTRKLWVVSIIGMHLGIIVFLGLGLFGAIMCVLTGTVFGISAMPRERFFQRSQALAVAAVPAT